MMGNYRVRFQGEGAPATVLPLPGESRCQIGDGAMAAVLDCDAAGSPTGAWTVAIGVAADAIVRDAGKDDRSGGSPLCDERAEHKEPYE
jgi:hypothetical protein